MICLFGSFVMKDAPLAVLNHGCYPAVPELFQQVLSIELHPSFPQTDGNVGDLSFSAGQTQSDDSLISDSVTVTFETFHQSGEKT